MDWSHVPAARRDVVAIPTIWLTLLVSLLFHAAMLWFLLPRLPNLSGNGTEQGKVGSVLVARLSPTPPASPASSAPPPPVAVGPPRQSAIPPTAMMRPPSAPTTALPAVPRMVRPPVSPSTAAAPPVAAPTSPPRTREADLSSYIAARRRERGDAPANAAEGIAPIRTPAEIENERRDRIIAANLASGGQPTFGYDPKSGGGIFEVTRMSDDDAEFYFTGWDKEIGRRAKQRFEVRRGNNSDIRLAIVRRIIAIIRDEVKDDFSWKSYPSGRVYQLSARVGDNEELEAFLMREFFSERGYPR
jgi:hypothetical protein